MFKRCYDNLDQLMKEGKALIIYGARQVGKTTLLKNFTVLVISGVPTVVRRSIG